MNRTHRIRRTLFTAALGFILTAIACVAQERPQSVVDLKPLGAAPDLFSDKSDSQYPQRGLITVFWLGNDRLAVAFSTTRRWNNKQAPEPLHIRLLTFAVDSGKLGKQLAQRDWDFGNEGPAGESNLELVAGPDDSILAIHTSTAPTTGKIPEGDFIRVLNADTSPRQDFYVPATSAYIPSLTAQPSLVLQSFYANKHTTLAWWTGNPLKPGAKLDLLPGSEETLVGPGVAARADCAVAGLCSGIRIFRPGKPLWFYTMPTAGTVATPLAFLRPDALLIELQNEDDKQAQLVIAQANGARTQLVPIPKGLQVLGVTTVSANAEQLSLTVAGEHGMCGTFGVWCNQVSLALVYDLPANRIVFRQELSPIGATTALSPDGKLIAIFDRNRLALYEVR